MNVPPCTNGTQFGHDFTHVTGDGRRRIRLCVFCGVLEVHWFDPSRPTGDVDGTRYFRAWQPE